MRRTLTAGEVVKYTHKVGTEDVAAFGGKLVHSVYSTFSLSRDAEYTTRLFVIDSVDEDEEGIGTSLSIEHMAPAFVGDEVEFEGMVASFEKGKLLCSWEARVEGKLIAKGTTGQKIMKKTEIEKLFRK